MANTINITIDKASMGLDQVNNTSDLNKPISTATQTYVDTAVSNASTPDATTLVKGKVRLAGDLAGTANSPTVPGLADRETIYSAQSPDLNFRFNKKTLHATIGSGSSYNPLTGNIGVYIETPMHINVTSVMLHNDSIAPTFSSEFTKSADSLPYITGQDNYIYATLVNLDPIRIIYTIKRGGTNIYSTFLTTDLKGANNGIAELDSSGKVPSSQLPSFVDDVVDYATLSAFPVTGESGKIYVALDTNLTYRWSGSVYVEISPSLALGETSASAYRGDRGKIAYDHSQLTSGNPHNVTKSDVGLSNVANLDTTNPVNIVQTASYRFVTDTEKSTWNGKQDLLGFTPENVANKSTDLTASATKYPTVNAVNTGLGLKENTITAGTTAQYYRGDKTFQTLDKTAVGLGNVDNTSDANKPISSATQTALDNKSDKNITLDRKTASYTLVANDNGKMIEMNVASANTLTINASLFSAGNQILISQYGAGQTTITAGAGVTLRSSGGKLKTSAQYSLVTIIAISSTEFYVAGDLTA